MRWLHEHASELGVDPERIGVMPAPSSIAWHGLEGAVAHVVRAQRAGHELPAGWVMRLAGFASTGGRGR